MGQVGPGKHRSAQLRGDMDQGLGTCLGGRGQGERGPSLRVGRKQGEGGPEEGRGLRPGLRQGRNRAMACTELGSQQQKLNPRPPTATLQGP